MNKVSNISSIGKGRLRKIGLYYSEFAGKSFSTFMSKTRGLEALIKEGTVVDRVQTITNYFFSSLSFAKLCNLFLLEILSTYENYLIKRKNEPEWKVKEQRPMELL
jgi:hypothetical protein